MILFVASPLSISSLRLMVIVLFKWGGSIGGGSAEAVEAAVADEAGCCAGPEGVDPLEGGAEPGFSGPIAGGSVESDGVSWAGRFTITVSPASLARPPASAKTSRRVTGRSAWQTMAWKTAPTTVIGLLFLS